ncbi:unnamed protein product [Leptosia nina]|uniref:Rhodanese domain-containing protein n=1 Tax=Leptosia nina TaxID=320188 RepID=A0AAV1J8X2_9NEOP
MTDPAKVVKYSDMLRIIHEPEKVIVDVRNPEELKETGKIPSSMNIPLGNLRDALSMSEADFKKQYLREKPTQSTDIIFYCKSGVRASNARDQALELGYSKSKTYIGSWTDWSNH